MSSGGGTTTQTSGLPPEFASILSGFGNAANQAMNLPYQQFNGPRVANLSPLQRQAGQGYSGLLGSGLWGSAGGAVNDLMSGSMNPYMQQVGQRVTKDVTDAYNRATAGNRVNFNDAGNLGGGQHNLAQNRTDQNLATGLTEGLGSLYGGEWTNMQNRRAQGAGLAGNLGNTYAGILGNSMQAGDVQRGFDQRVIDANYGDWQRANDYPWTQLERGSGVLGSLMGGAPRQTTTTGPGPDRVSQGLGIWALGSNLMKGK